MAVASAKTTGKINNAPKMEMTGHHGASTVVDMARYVRTHQIPDRITATATDAQLNMATVLRLACGGDRRKNAHALAPAIGKRINRAAITVTL